MLDRDSRPSGIDVNWGPRFEEGEEEEEEEQEKVGEASLPHKVAELSAPLCVETLVI